MNGGIMSRSSKYDEILANGIPHRNEFSPVDRDWTPSTPNTTGPMCEAIGELFGLIREALRADQEVYVDLRSDGMFGHKGRTHARVYDLQHKAGDWLRVGIVHENPQPSLADDWYDFSAIDRAEIDGSTITVIRNFRKNRFELERS